MMPTRRDLHFPIPKDRMYDWHGDGAHISQFFNTLSVFFPRGERFFIDSVRYYRDKITDPELKKAVTAFVGQEAMHSREHQVYNEMLEAAGLPAGRQERFTTRFLDFMRDYLPKNMQLSATIALEHWTAMLADLVLSQPEQLDGAHEDFARMWRWHALEETEHKAVAFDVYEKVFGRGPLAYLNRCLGLILGSLIFWPMVFFFHVQMVHAVPKDRRDGHIKGYAKVLRFLLWKPGVLPRTFKPWLDYFRPGFHPWMHDNSQFLSQIDQLQAEAERAYAAAS